MRRFLVTRLCKSSLDNAAKSCPILEYKDVKIASFPQLLCGFFALSLTYFQEEPPPRGEEAGGLANNLGEEVHAVRAAIEGEGGLKADFSLEVFHFPGGEVGGVRHHHVKGGVGAKGGKEVAFTPVEVGGAAEAAVVFLGEA